jgi:23S rRNA pseudouridine2605 synthase
MGITLDDGVTAPARVKLTGYDPAKDTATLQIIIREGRNRQIRRMCEAIGHPVGKLKRTEFAFLTLEGVHRGRYRQLTPEEIARLRQLAGKSGGVKLSFAATPVAAAGAAPAGLFSCAALLEYCGYEMGKSSG